MDNKTEPQGMSVRDQMIDYAERNTVIDLSGRRVYIAGPMTGIAELNRPAFFAAEEYLKGQGAIVMNPAVLPDGFEHHQYMKIAISMLMQCDVVAFLPGWQESKGARVEFTRSRAFALVQVALDMGKPIEGKPWVVSHKPLLV